MMTATTIQPCQFKLEGKIAPEWAMAKPLPITLEQGRDGDFTTRDDLFIVYGKGDTAIAALRDYMAKLVEHYRLLEMRATTGDETTRTQFQRIQSYIYSVAP